MDAAKAIGFCLPGQSKFNTDFPQIIFPFQIDRIYKFGGLFYRRLRFLFTEIGNNLRISKAIAYI